MIHSPIGTYRIYLAYTNFRATGDKRYFVPIDRLMSLMSNEELERLSPYILKPFGPAGFSPLVGNMSLTPIPVTPYKCTKCGHVERENTEEEQLFSS